MPVKLFAPAKVNLDLSITGVRPDGYHTLRSHVAFADCGDDIVLTIDESDTTTCAISVDGLFAWQLDDVPAEHNLAVRAVHAFSRAYNLSFAANIHLTKNLPSGAGLGGGSADAAAILRGLVQRFGVDDTQDAFQTMCLSLGADVPVCYASKPCLMEGIGEMLSPWETDDAHAVLIWPGVGGSTKDLYAAYDAAPANCDPGGNDFQPLAARFCPQITDALKWLSTLPGCAKTQLTGSGTAVFGLFPAAPQLPENKAFPWIQPCRIGSVNKPLVSASGAG